MNKKYYFKGKIKSKPDGYCYVKVDDELVNGLYSNLSKDHKAIKKSPYFGKGEIGAHISFISSEEGEKLEKKIDEIGEEVEFNLGNVIDVNPKGWDEMERVWFIQVDAPRLAEIRKKYKLPATYNGDGHKWHMTFAVKKRKTSANWYCQCKYAQQDIAQQYQELIQQQSPVNIIGTGQGESISVGSSSIPAMQLLNEVRSRLMPILQEKNVHTIDTSPISDQMAQGLAISHEPGVIHVDVQKIFNNAKQSLPTTAQLDAVSQSDPDILQSIVNQVTQYILGELFETTAHESQHTMDYVGAYEGGQPFTSVQEAPAEQFGRQMRQRYAALKAEPYPFAEKEEQYRKYTIDQLLYALRDAREAREAQDSIEKMSPGLNAGKDWNWRQDDVLTIMKIIQEKSKNASSKRKKAPKNVCWEGYEMIGKKKKDGKDVPKKEAYNISGLEDSSITDFNYAPHEEDTTEFDNLELNDLTDDYNIIKRYGKPGYYVFMAGENPEDHGPYETDDEGLEKEMAEMRDKVKDEQYLQMVEDNMKIYHKDQRGEVIRVASSKKKNKTPAWQREEGKSRSGGLNQKGRDSYNKETGGNLKAPVTEDKPKGERKKRQDSYCARSKGQKEDFNIDCRETPEKPICKSRKRWNCD